jgi:hypothetical protein
VTRAKLRQWFWIIFSSCALATFLSFIPAHQKRNAQANSAAILTLAIQGDSRFSKVVARCAANGPFFFVNGEVRSDADLIALKKVIIESRLPEQPIVSVKVEPSGQRN